MRLTTGGAGEQGQALVVVAICIAVLVAGLAFGVDWGYAMVQRRVMQNLADASALGVGKYLATSVIELNGAPAFAVTQEEAWCAAKSYDTPNRSFAPAGTATQLDVFYSADGTTWTTSQRPTGDVCPTSGGTAIPAGTIYVRVVGTVTFSSLVASFIGHSASTASASARVRLSGTPVPLTGGPLWSMVRHYDPSDFNIRCTPSPCDPTDPSQATPITFWSANGNNVVYGNFKGLIDYSRYSSRFAGSVPQLMTQWDTAFHSPNPLAIDKSGNCTAWGVDAFGNHLWDSQGEANANQDKQCSIPNWFYYGFRGRLALDSSWSGSSLPTGQETPSPLPTTRAVCSTPPNPAPSCTDGTLGDWVETAGGDVGNNMASAMTQAINDFGSADLPFSQQPVPGGHGTLFGKGLVVLVFLWDCAESYNANAAPGSQWSLVLHTNGRGANDCSQLTKNDGTPDRVHVFTVAPFTFYAALVSSNQIQGYWGGVFGNPDACQSCALNPLANTAVLVPDG
jgi:Flp pilus assembly protein TadG